MKTCSKCGEEKVVDLFGKDKSTTTGLAAWCRLCCAEKNKALYRKNREERLAYAKRQYEEDPTHFKEKMRADYQKNKDQRLESAKRYQSEKSLDPVFIKTRNAKSRERYLDDPEKMKAQQRLYAAANPERFRAKAAARRSSVRRATPPWADLDVIGEFYLKARELSETTGIKHNVDHIVPLIHPTVCGLHVWWNLEVLTQSENCSKGNRIDLEAA